MILSPGSVQDLYLPVFPDKPTRNPFSDDLKRQSRRDYERNCGRQPFTNIVDVKAAVGLPNSVA